MEWLVSIPWTEKTEDRIDIAYAEEILNRDHDGLEKVKERVLEYLSVRQLMNSLRGPILCLAGPPGVGKTSLARSIAESLDRKFVRVSLGGVRDESEIRGHRRTYVGAMPGRIIQGMKKQVRQILYFYLMKLIKCQMTSVETHLLQCWKYWIRSKTIHSVITSLKSHTICRMYYLSQLQMI